MKILFTRFPLESALGGAERQTLSLMKGLRDLGHAVAFLGSCPTLLKETVKLGIPSARVEIGPPPVTKWGAVSFAWRKKNMQEKLTRALDSFEHPDAVFMLSMSEKLLMTDAAVKRGMKVFWIEHDRVGPWLRKNPWLPTLRKLSERVTTICVSELSRKIYLDLGWKPENIVAIPNGIDLKKFSRVTPNLQSLISNLHLGSVSRLSQEKGLDVLIHAVSRLPEVSLTIVGKGPEENYLHQLINQIHSSEMMDHERIRIVHHVDDLREFYRSIDALVLPSRDNDPFGLVAAEAMACGTPVIVTDQCGIAGYLTNGDDAIIAKADSDTALREAILGLMETKVRQGLSENGWKTSHAIFSEERMIEKYVELLK